MSSLHAAFDRAGAITAQSTVLVAPREFVVEERILEPSAADVVIRVAYSGICGSDFPIVDGLHPRAAFPVVLGHEITGKIELPGDSGLRIGAHVAVSPLLACGECGACAMGLSHVCRSLRLRGIDLDGSMTTHLAVPSSAVVAFEADVDARQAALAEPVAVAVNSVDDRACNLVKTR